MGAFGLSIAPSALLADDFWQFSTNYGNAASVVGLAVSVLGLLVSLIAFPVTWLRQWEIRRVLRQEVQRLALAVLGGQMEELERLLAALKEACRAGHWLRAYDRSQDARALAIRSAGNVRLSPADQDVLRSGADDLRMIAAYINTQKLKAPTPAATFHQPKEQALDSFIDKLGEIRSRLESKIWEVLNVN